MNPQEIWLLAQDHQRQLRSEAERIRALTPGYRNRGTRRRHVLAVVGDLLISLGTRLCARYGRRGGLERSACDPHC